MDPILGGLILEGFSRGAKGYQTYSAQKDLFDEDAAKRLKELERMEAINMLGGDIQTYQSQQMTPVQGAMREARERMAQDISSQDLSGGAYFRGQQAMTEAAGKERSAAQARAQEQYRREEDINRAEMESLKKRKKVADNAARDAFLAAVEGVDKSGQAYMMMELEQKKIAALRTAAGDAPKEEVEAASVGLDIGIGGTPREYDGLWPKGGTYEFGSTIPSAIPSTDIVFHDQVNPSKSHEQDLIMNMSGDELIEYIKQQNFLKNFELPKRIR